MTKATSKTTSTTDDVTLGEVSAGIVEAISTGLYKNISDVIREYVQNSHDAIRDQFGKRNTNGIIKIVVDNKRKTLSIVDNGCGMNRSKLIRAVNIGYSSKGEDDVGFRGIGMMAGWAIADRIIVLSKTTNDDTHWKAEIASKKVRKAVEDIIHGDQDMTIKEIYRKYVKISKETPTELPTFPEGHGTMVVLERIREAHAKLLKKGTIVDYLSQVAPIRFKPPKLFEHSKQITKEISDNVDYFSPSIIEVNGWSVTKPYDYDEAAQDPKFEVIYTRNGDELAFIWYQLRNRSSRNESTKGLRLFVKGFRIGDSNYVQNEFVTFKQKNLSDWVIGEIHVLSKRILPTSDRNSLKDNDERMRLIKHLQEFGKKLDKEVRKISDRNSAARKSLRAREKAEFVLESIETEPFTRTEAAGIAKDVRETRLILEGELEKLVKKGDKEIIKSSKIRGAIKHCKKAERTILDVADDDEEVLDLDKDMAKIYWRLKSVIDKFDFIDYAAIKSTTLINLRADLITQIGLELSEIGDE